MSLALWQQQQEILAVMAITPNPNPKLSKMTPATHTTHPRIPSSSFTDTVTLSDI